MYELTIEGMAEEYNWRETFGFAGQPGTCNDSHVMRVDGGKTEGCTPFTINDVAAVLAMDEGENDGPPWQITMLLWNGVFVFLEAGCDYTGWSCVAAGTAWKADTLEELLRWGYNDRARERVPVEDSSELQVIADALKCGDRRHAVHNILKRLSILPSEKHCAEYWQALKDHTWA